MVTEVAYSVLRIREVSNAIRDTKYVNATPS